MDDEDIQELERISGDLTLALLWITGFLANRSKRRDGSDLMCDRGYRGKYDLEAYRKTKELFDRIYEKRLAAVGVFYGRQEEADIREALQDADLAMTKDSIWISRCYDCDDGVIAEGVTEGVAMDITDNIVEDDAEDPAEDGDWDIRKDIAEDVIVRLVGDLDLNAGAYSDEGNDHNLEFTCRNDSLRFKQGSQPRSRIKQPQGTLETSSSSLGESTGLRKSLVKMMTKAGVEQQAIRRAGHHNWRLQMLYNLVNFVVHGEDFTDTPCLAVRADLSRHCSRYKPSSIRLG